MVHLVALLQAISLLELNHCKAHGAMVCQWLCSHNLGHGFPAILLAMASSHNKARLSYSAIGSCWSSCQGSHTVLAATFPTTAHACLLFRRLQALLDIPNFSNLNHAAIPAIKFSQDSQQLLPSAHFSVSLALLLTVFSQP